MIILMISDVYAVDRWLYSKHYYNLNDYYAKLLIENELAAEYIKVNNPQALPLNGSGGSEAYNLGVKQ